MSVAMFYTLVNFITNLHWDSSELSYHISTAHNEEVLYFRAPDATLEQEDVTALILCVRDLIRWFKSNVYAPR